VGKLLIWVIIILAIMMIARIASARAAHKRHSATQPPPRAPARRPGGQPVESMVRCAHCGIHLPRSEAVLLEGKVWCSRDHARLGER